MDFWSAVIWKTLTPGKIYFMNLAAKSLSEVNGKIVHDGILLVRKATIRLRLALNTNGCWEITQLFQHLQDVIRRYPINKQNFKSSSTQFLLSLWALVHWVSLLTCTEIQFLADSSTVNRTRISWFGRVHVDDGCRICFEKCDSNQADFCSLDIFQIHSYCTTRKRLRLGNEWQCIYFWELADWIFFSLMRNQI